MEKTYQELTYVICHNGKDIIHPSKVEIGTNVATGQPEFEEYLDEETWKNRLVELGYDISLLDEKVNTRLPKNLIDNLNN